jgi:hypothetical protein
MSIWDHAKSNGHASSSLWKRGGKAFALSQAVDTVRYAADDDVDGEDYGRRVVHAISAGATALGGPLAGVGASVLADKVIGD